MKNLYTVVAFMLLACNAQVNAMSGPADDYVADPVNIDLMVGCNNLSTSPADDITKAGNSSKTRRHYKEFE